MARTKSIKLVLGNWKMNPVSLAEAKRIIKETKKIAAKLSSTKVVVCPPFQYLSLITARAAVSKALGKIGVGAQNAHAIDQGSFTGEVSAPMLKNMGVGYTIIGHSERRKMGETDEVVAKKAKTVIESGMTAVICIGENVRDEQGTYLDELRTQIKASLQGIARKDMKQVVMAYEPVWAIGAKEAMTPALVHETSIFIKKVLSDTYGQEEGVKVPILYGGSVNFRNARDIIAQGQVDGLLVGRESLNPPGFAELLKEVDSVK